MFLTRRDDDDDFDDSECWTDGRGNYFGDCGFWYSEKGIITKYTLFALTFLFFLTWFIGGYIHAKSRLKKGLPLLGYHRWLVSYSTRRRYGQAPPVPQNHFTFYSAQRPYGGPQYGGGYGGQPVYRAADGTYAEPPPMYGGEAPPSYFAPPGQQQGPKPPVYGAGQEYPMMPVGGQQVGVVGSGSAAAGDVEGQNQGLGQAQGQAQGQGESSQQQQSAALPPRPEQAKLAFTKFVSRFKR
jgi:hypothetical protein